jgi:hypothetical protein
VNDWYICGNENGYWIENGNGEMVVVPNKLGTNGRPTMSTQGPIYSYHDARLIGAAKAMLDFLERLQDCNGLSASSRQELFTLIGRAAGSVRRS